MNLVIGEILPLAVGIAISPIPIIAAILMLLSPRAKGTSVGFMIGWLAGIVGGQLRGARHIVSHLTGLYPATISADVPRSWCVRCHSEATLAASHVQVNTIGSQRCGACHNHAPGARFAG